MKIINANYSIIHEATGFPMPSIEIAIRNIAGQIKVARNSEIIASFHSESVAHCDASAFDQELTILYGQIYGRVGLTADRAALFAEIRRFI